jgi:hypothetical protein
MPRIRTLSETYEHIKQMDEDTAITPNALRRMVVSGQIPYTKAGKKYLIDIDVLFEYLKGTRPEQVPPGYKNSFGNSRK